MKHLYRYSIFIESFFFLTYFLFYTLSNAYRFFSLSHDLPDIFKAILVGEPGLRSWLQLSEVLIVFSLVIFNALLVVSLLIRKNLRKPPDRLIEIILPLVGTLGVALYNLLPNLPTQWTTNLAPEMLYPYFLLAGSFITLAGLTISIRSIYDLRESFGILVQVRNVVRHGIYRWVRHPMYLGYMTTGLGFLFIQPNLANLIITTLVILANIERAILEERKIAATSADYREFQKTVPFMIPKINKKVGFIIAGILLGGFVLTVTAFYYLIFTTGGSKKSAEVAIDTWLDSPVRTIEKAQGSIKDGLVLHNIELKDTAFLPPNAILRAQEIRLNTRSLDWKKGEVQLTNTRLFLPSSEPIVADGAYSAGTLNLNIYSKSVSLSELTAFEHTKKYAIRGSVEDVDLHLAGPADTPQISGTMTISSLNYKNFFLQSAPANFDVLLEKQQDVFIPKGKLQVNSGTLRVNATDITLSPGEIIFEGDWRNPSLTLRGEATVDSVKIHITLKGTMHAPELTLNSSEGLPSDMLLVMLATGKRWSSVETSLQGNKIEPDVARDFLDYFLFGGSGKRLTKRLGIKDVRIILDKDTKGWGLTKALSRNVDLGYQITQKQTPLEPLITTQKLEGDWKLSNTLSFSVEKETETILDPTVEEKKKQDNQFLLKYKKNF